MFTKKFLIEKRNHAFRRGVWYKILDKNERNIMNLTIHVVDRVKSTLLGLVILKIIKKLKDALMNSFVMKMKRFGVRRVQKLIDMAVDWHNEAARDWVSDSGFVKYVTMTEINK